MHLSFPPGASINDGIDIANFPLRYSTVADAMDSCMRLGRGALMAKLDVQSAFRLCPVRPDEHHLLGMCWQGRYFFDRVLPFGLRSAPFIFNTLAEALEWIARQHGLTYIHHYLDDSLSLVLPTPQPALLTSAPSRPSVVRWESLSLRRKSKVPPRSSSTSGSCWILTSSRPASRSTSSTI